jgi:hypothetical protein
MWILGILGVVVVRRVWLLGVRVTVVALAHLTATMVLSLALWLTWAFVPVDIPTGTVTTGDYRAATTAVLSLRWVAVLSSLTGFYWLARIRRLLVQLVVDIRAHFVPIFF